MPQELRVIRCFQCLKYQVDIVKKANKWVCKVCGVKQSLVREFFRGTGKDCRSTVQQLSMRNLAKDQQEEEVVKLVLENKIQLPRPPVEAPTAAADFRERNEPIQGPSKWDSFLSKETANDDPDDGLSGSDSFETVSSTTFDRERINCAENSLKATGASGWHKNRMTRPDLPEYGTKLPSDIGKESLSTSSWVAASKNPTFKPIGPAGKAKQTTTISFQGTDKRWNYFTRNDSAELPSFHRKENSSNRVFPNTTSKFVAKASVDQSPSTSMAPVSSVNYKPPEMPGKRKRTENPSIPPLMNFGKRPAIESKSAPANSTVPLDNVCEKRPPTDAKTTGASSTKWAKYLQEDDETDENTDNSFILF